MNIKITVKILIIVLGISFSYYLVLYHTVTSRTRNTLISSTSPQLDSNISAPIASEENVRNKTEPKIMKILYWLGRKKYEEDSNYLKRIGCKVTNCQFTTNSSAVDAMDWDAIVVDTWAKGLYKALGHKRNPKTYWIYYSAEPPHHSKLIKPSDYYKGIEFNLSLTWRRDSDFFRAYFISSKLDQPRKSYNLVNYAAEKTKKIAWMVSNCNPKSKRQILVRSLKKHIQVDIFGKCGTRKKCDKSCQEMIHQKYKFYLSFENELCVDYITEKLSRPYKNNMVPVVYGLGYENSNLPPHSYIDVFDFSNVKELADYLNYLDRNDTAYNEYFMWKKNYKLTSDRWKACEMCEFLQKANDFNSDPTARGNMMEKKEPVIPPKNGPIKINMPKKEDSLKQIYINGSNFRILDAMKWFDAVCVNPNNDRNIHNFINGL